MDDAEIIIVGAGPAGMAAAALAANQGAKVLLLDEQPQAGGQIYRNIGSNIGTKNHNKDSKSYLGKEYAAGNLLVEALEHRNITLKFDATVWRLEEGPRVVWSQHGITHVSCAKQVLLAGGAQERPMPFPGWTLAGVMSAGAAQILMKTSGLLPRDAILAGSGPLLYLVAAQMIDAGSPPKALVETQTSKSLFAALPYFPRALLATATLFKGFSLLRKIRSAGVKRYTSAANFRATTTNHGDIAFRFASKGQNHSLMTPLLLTHQGVVPATHLSRASGINHQWNEAQGAFQAITNAWGRTEVEGIHIAGDGAAIGGAESATAAGRLAAFDMLYQLGKLSKAKRDQKSKVDRAAFNRALCIRPFLDAFYSPLPEFLSPPDETVVCRCEEVTAAEVRHSLNQGANGPRQVKTDIRAGMGPCQGRMCDLTIRGILLASGVTPEIPRARTPIKPITLGEMANIEKS